MQNEKKKIIMSLDLSIQSTGVAIIDGDNAEVIAYDNIPIGSKEFNGDEMKKIIHIAETVLSIANGYEVTHIAIEDSYVDKKYQGTGKTLARLFGAVYITLYINGYTLIYTYTPSQWKKITTGIGNKSKEGTHKWVCDNMVDLGEFHSRGKKKNDDIADALGLAYCLYKKLNK